MILLESPWFWLISLGIFASGLQIAWLFLLKPAAILYALAFSVSFIAVNVNIGFTIYVSRLLLIMLAVTILIRGSLGINGGLQLRIDQRFIVLFAGILLVQSLALPVATSPIEHVRQIFIYLSMMAIFTAIMILGINTEVVVKALRLYLAFGIVQGLTGMYQTIGAFLRWPMYQDIVYGRLLSVVKTGNERNLMGIFWSRDDSMVRAFGFFSDVNHYGGYMVGVILLSLAFLLVNRRDILAYMALLAGGAGLTLSLSRSAWVTLLVFGIPAFWGLSLKVNFRLRNLMRLVKAIGIALAILAGISFIAASGNLFNIQEVVTGRIANFVSGASSFEPHILTRMMALDAWMTSPLIGIGLDSHASPWYSSSYQALYRGAHSHHINVLAGSGLLGLMFEWTFMAFVGLRMWRGLVHSRHGSPERAVMVGLLATYVAILLGNLLYHYYMNDFVWFLMGCGVALSREINCKYRSATFVNSPAKLKTDSNLSIEKSKIMP